MGRRRFYLILGLCVFTHKSVVKASLRTEIYPTDYCAMNCYSDKGIPRDLVQVYDYMQTQNTSTDYGKMIPKDLQSGQDPMLVANKIADQGMQYWWNNSGVKNSPMGQNVSSVENSMKKDVDLGKSNSGVQQKLNFNVDAFQTQAKLKYEGYTNCEMYYQARDSSMGLQMINKVGTNKDIIIKTSSDQTSNVTFKWGF